MGWVLALTMVEETENGLGLGLAARLVEKRGVGWVVGMGLGVEEWWVLGLAAALAREWVLVRACQKGSELESVMEHEWGLEMDLVTAAKLGVRSGRGTVEELATGLGGVSAGRWGQHWVKGLDPSWGVLRGGSKVEGWEEQSIQESTRSCLRPKKK